jgi:predicted amidophosphoribosyltransferase
LINIYNIEKILKEAIGENRYNFNSSEILSDEQVRWIKDEGRCSACGEALSISDVFCPECGLRIKKGKPYKPYNISKYNDKKITYYYKPPK